MTEQVEIVVIGSGLGGLSCAALLARYGYDVLVCESHEAPGGAAHAFERQGYCFDSGPSLFSGLSYRPSTNPLRQVLDAVAEDLDWLTYDGWGCRLPEGDFIARVGADDFAHLLQDLRGSQAVAEWRSLQAKLEPLARAAVAVPPAALRNDGWAALSLARYGLGLIEQLPRLGLLTGPFSRLMDTTLSDPFLRNWLDLLCFLLSGLPASGTITAEMAFMFAEWYQPNVVLDYPQGGTGQLVAALVRGLRKFGGDLWLKTHVEQIWLEGDRPVGVHLRDGRQIRASKAVVSAISAWDLLALLPEAIRASPPWQRYASVPAAPSFLHLHLGIDAKGLANLECHYITVRDWSEGIESPQNVVVLSIPSVLDPTLAPPGKHVIHAYTPATEPYDLWVGLDRAGKAYRQLKAQRTECLWLALERIIPDIRQRCELSLEGTPLTHGRFLRRHRGSYGPLIPAGTGRLPGATTPLPGLYCCGEASFPGIGVPAVAASGWIAANTLTPLDRQLALLRELQI
jgi:phytoene dehydrogenase-like protein